MKKQNIQRQKQADRSTDHLINPKEFQMMDQREKMYNKASRENKKSVDIVNRKLFAKRK